MKLLAGLRIGPRLSFAFAVLLALLLLIASFALIQMRQQAELISEVINKQTLRVSLAEGIQRNALQAALPLLQLLVTPERDKRVPLYKEMDDANERMNQSMKGLLDGSSPGADRDRIELLASSRLAYKALALDMLEQIEVSGPESARDQFVAKTQPSLNTLLSKASELVVQQHASMAAAQEALATKLLQTQRVVLVIVCLAIGIGAMLAWLVTRSITNPLSDAVAVTERVAAGDLSSAISVRSSDEVGLLLSALNRMQTRLSETVGKVRANSQSVSAASAEIAQGNIDLSNRTEQQAAALEKTASSMDELNATVKQNAENANTANHLAVTASNIAAQGGQVVGEVVATMKEINASSRMISEIIGVIDEIAFQTNILALNAAVEAARAGTQGVGFAVVATEVRSLAGHTAKSAKEIKSLIAASVERVEAGTALVDKAGATMTQVVESIRKVTDIMGDISAASNEQATGVAQVGEAVNYMDRGTQQNAALVEEMAAAASSLSTQAQELVQAVAAFKLG